MTTSVLQFGEFEVDLRARELRRQGLPLRLQEQPFQILAMLLDCPGDVVAREAIRERLWPEGTFVDFEHGVNAAIKRLRTALGDSADSPRFIETLHRRGYRFVGHIHEATVPKAYVEPVRTRADDRRPRLVVLPFATFTENADDYFVDGLTEELIAQLGRRCASRIGVLARTSSMLYKNATRAASDIGETLKADYLVEGSVRRSGDRVRITVQLVETRGETHLWAESYDRNLSDCLVVQTEVATEIAQALALELLPGAPSSAPATRNGGAYQAFLRGRFHWNRQGDQGLETAIAYYDEALSLDPHFAPAYAARARARLSLCDYYVVGTRTALGLVRADALRALSYDAANAEAHLALGEVRRTLDWDWSGAEAAYRQALTANPNSEAAHRYYGLFLAARRRSEARAIIDRACELDPLCLTIQNSGATLRYFVGEHEAAVDRCRHILAMEPDFLVARQRLGASLVQLRQYDQAIDLLAPLGDPTRDPVSAAWLGHAYAAQGNRAAACGLVNALERGASDRPVPPYHLAMVYAGLGNRDAAFSALARACEERDPALDTFDVEPRFTTLRDDDRYGALLERLSIRQPSASL